MSIRGWFESPRTRLDITAGLVDGVLTALTLASGRLLEPGSAPNLDLAIRVGAATGLTTLFVFFVAHYAELRAEINRAEKELNLLSHGKLAAGALGQRAIREAFAGALLAAFCGLAGAMIPLWLCFALPSPRWLGLIITIGLLGVMGAILARSFRGSATFWIVVLVLGGLGLTWAGLELRIAG
jgi:predicted membrane protein (TIGR00267 family)